MTFKTIRYVVRKASILYPIEVPLWHLGSTLGTRLMAFEAGSSVFMVAGVLGAPDDEEQPTATTMTPSRTTTISPALLVSIPFAGPRSERWLSNFSFFGAVESMLNLCNQIFESA